ncbi:unnamed protein product [Moneuplotes crassus]|uniref:Uncharacterized protein n=1 Tax=Euplotes crassus TaxID=5936 RepID=A0AAD1XBF0_EUPCR|nr:unnamed protein product [Moneuplotes crassus]
MKSNTALKILNPSPHRSVNNTPSSPSHPSSFLNKRLKVLTHQSYERLQRMEDHKNKLLILEAEEELEKKRQEEKLQEEREMQRKSRAKIIKLRLKEKQTRLPNIVVTTSVDRNMETPLYQRFEEEFKKKELPQIKERQKILKTIKQERNTPMRINELFEHEKKYKSMKLQLVESLERKRKAETPVHHYNPKAYSNHFTELVKKLDIDAREKETKLKHLSLERLKNAKKLYQRINTVGTGTATTITKPQTTTNFDLLENKPKKKVMKLTLRRGSDQNNTRHQHIKSKFAKPINIRAIGGTPVRQRSPLITKPKQVNKIKRRKKSPNKEKEKEKEKALNSTENSNTKLFQASKFPKKPFLRRKVPKGRKISNNTINPNRQKDLVKSQLEKLDRVVSQIDSFLKTSSPCDTFSR